MRAQNVNFQEKKTIDRSAGVRQLLPTPNKSTATKNKTRCSEGKASQRATLCASTMSHDLHSYQRAEPVCVYACASFRPCVPLAFMHGTDCLKRLAEVLSLKYLGLAAIISNIPQGVDAFALFALERCVVLLDTGHNDDRQDGRGNHIRSHAPKSGTRAITLQASFIAC